jgi:hypothetical protein
MFPIRKNPLTLLKIADYWSREIKPPASSSELLVLLESAWWRGEIGQDFEITRLQLLRGMFKAKQDFGVVFSVEKDVDGTTITYLDGGIVEVEVRAVITVPTTDSDCWTDESCADAYATLANLTSADVFPVLSPVLASITVHREEFLAWVSGCHQVPSFWTDAAARDSSIASAGVRAAPHLETKGRRGRRGPARGSISRYGEADRKLFPEIEKLEGAGQTVNAITKAMAAEKRVEGSGTPDSKAKRLAKAYRIHKMENLLKLAETKSH